MPNSTSDLENASEVQSVTIKEFAHALKEARETNRQIVPIVGAGLSADSGFPVITAIVRYFGKLYGYIEQRGPLRHSNVPKIEYLENLFEEYQEKPWRFVEDFGWPDRFQLNQDLYASLGEDPNQTSKRSVEKAIRDSLHKVLPLVNQPGSTAYERFCEEIRATLDEAEKEAGADKDVIAALVRARDRLNKDSSRSSAFDIVGDWRRLILSFTNYRSDYADALFTRFGSSRQPGQGHRFLAYLIRYLAVPTVFTFNFDSLIEQTLEADGDRPRVFAMERGAALPHDRLVRDRLSVIKMHGSTHALLLDEQLDRPLSPEYLQRFEGYYFIWIDLEAVHTFAGVVGTIIDQCRKYDHDLAPSVLPVDIDGLGNDGKEGHFLNATIDLSVNRVARALRRTRYYLALDGLETYVWPATTHHGLSHNTKQR